MSLALQIENLHYHYRSDMLLRPFHALKGVSVDVREGEFFGFLGNNGGGKTTTIKCVLGLIRPSQGTIRIFGEEHRKTSARRLVGYLPEQPYFYDHLTVCELVTMYGVLVGLRGAKLRSRVDEVLALLGISDRADNKLRSLSKGLTQRMAMAQAIIGAPKLLILDEPFSGLDPVGRKDFRDLLFRLKSEGTTIFISTHIISDIEFLCDRASIIVRGELKGVFDLKTHSELNSGSYELVLRNSSSKLREELGGYAIESKVLDPLATYHFANRELGQRAITQALSENAIVEGFNFVHPSLEDLFVELVKRKTT